MTAIPEDLADQLEECVSESITWGPDAQFRYDIADPMQIDADEELVAIVFPNEPIDQQNNVQYQQEQIGVDAELSGSVSEIVSWFVTLLRNQGVTLEDVAVSGIEGDDVFVSATVPIEQTWDGFDELAAQISEEVPMDVPAEKMREIRCDLHGYNEYSPPGTDDVFSNCYDVVVEGVAPVAPPEMRSLDTETYLETHTGAEPDAEMAEIRGGSWMFGMAPIQSADAELEPTIDRIIKDQLSIPEEWQRAPMEWIATQDEVWLPVRVAASLSEVVDAWDAYRTGDFA